MKQRELDDLGDPQLQIAGLRVWVHGRAHPDATDYWDGNWLRATAYCIYPDSMVRAHGSIIHLGELVGLHQSCKHVHEMLKGTAALKCIEPNLAVTLEIQWNGAIAVNIQITPDHMSERHSFDDALDQTYLPAIIEQCAAILELYPVREPEHLPPRGVV